MKIYYMVVFSVLLMVLFHIAGLNTISDTSWVANNLNIFNLENFNDSAFMLLVVGLFGVVGLGTAIIGSFTNVSPQYILKSSIIMPVLVLLIIDVIHVLSLVDGWVKWVMLAIIAPIAGGWGVAIIEFWEARD